MKWIGQHIYDQISRFRNDVHIEGGNITSYNPVNDGNPTISLGSSATERLEIKAQYESGAQGLDVVKFTTYTAGSSTNDGRFSFYPDEVLTFQIRDHGINLAASKSLRINNTDIISDSGGTATLSNIDDLDATTIATFNSHLTAGDITGVTAGDGLSGGGTSGTVTLTVEAAQPNITSLGTLTGLVLDGDKNVTPGDGAMIHVDASTVTDSNTSGSGTAAMYTHVSIESPRLAATNDSVTTTSAATLYIGNAPTAYTNQTITNQYALWVDAGTVQFDADLKVGGTITGNITGDVTGDVSGQAGTVATIAGLAPNTATTQVTQAAITTCANLVTVGTIGTGVWQGTAVASAYLDADTMHYSAQRQLTHHMFKDDIGSTKHYIGLQEADAESTGTTSKNLPLLAPVAGKLLKVFLRASSDLSGDQLTWRLETRASSASTFGSPSVIGTVTGTGCTASSMTTYDFTAVTNTINVGDQVLLSIQSDDAGSDNTNDTHLVTCLWEWDLS